MTQKIDFSLYINDGSSFQKLFDYLKCNSDNGILIFTPNSISYNELVPQSDNSDKTLNVSNVCDFDITKIGNYEYSMDEPEYLVYFTLKTFKGIIKNTKKKDKIFMYKTADDNAIYVKVIKPGENASSVSVSYIRPLAMQDSNYTTYSDINKNDDVPDCVVSPTNFKNDCSNISPTDYKKITIFCSSGKMEIKAISVDNSDGHLIQYGKSNTMDINSIDVSKINLNFDRINLNSFNTFTESVKVNIIQPKKDLLLELPTSTFKNLVKLTQFSNDNIKFYFEDGYIKILTHVGNYGTLRTFISN